MQSSAKKVLPATTDILNRTGIQPGDKREKQPMAIQLKDGEVFPTTQGHYLTCGYHVDVECDIAWASDVNLYLPVPEWIGWC